MLCQYPLKKIKNIKAIDAMLPDEDYFALRETKCKGDSSIHVYLFCQHVVHMLYSSYPNNEDCAQ